MDIKREPIANEVTDVPEWINEDICGQTIINIQHGGCASGSYMPAVTYYHALKVMNRLGDEVIEYICDALGELPPPKYMSWSDMSCQYLSLAVELWAGRFEVVE
jgi:hypothetical protein